MRASSPTDRRRRALLALGAAALAGACAAPRAPAVAEAAPAEVRAALAPTGTLRIAVYPGSPTSLVQAAPPESMRGMTVDIGRELARRLGVPHAIVVRARVAEVVETLQRGDADVTVTNATPERARVLDFAEPLVALELGVLVPAGSPVATLDAIDGPSLRIGVSQGGSSERALRARLKQATLLPQPSLQAAADALRGGRLDAFATNKAILHELAPQVPGARVLDGRWGLEHLALGVPKGRDAGLPWLRGFSASMQAEGHVARAAERAGLRGTAAAEAR